MAKVVISRWEHKGKQDRLMFRDGETKSRLGFLIPQDLKEMAKGEKLNWGLLLSYPSVEAPLEELGFVKRIMCRGLVPTPSGAEWAKAMLDDYIIYSAHTQAAQ